MSAILEAQKLAYISAPKCACTSIKELIFRLENNCNFNKIRDQCGAIRLQINGQRRYIHHFYPTIPYKDQPHHALNNLDSFCVVRNPFDRLVSCYRNRVIRYGELKSEKIRNLEIDAPSDPNLNEFVYYLDQYNKAPNINHHTLPLTHFLGRKPEIYTKIYNLKTIHELPKFLKCYFGYTKSLDHLQTSQSEKNPETSSNFLSSISIQNIQKRYRDDFENFGQYF